MVVRILFNMLFCYKNQKSEFGLMWISIKIVFKNPTELEKFEESNQFDSIYDAYIFLNGKLKN